ncbi:T9SS type A sorting domain-containing protein [Flavicella sp.]|uniref:T9SS type A sorting domain-containing protein n=1 Tax=Flavicella sp. TaxID=2957742 RepID=UPI0026081DEF|nr:T9SS type A sorting domain-containing protein [Flavicella sp.]MDG1804315.1 T9SS type A sorting domain-containing protein [Flavicella sp.]
MKQTLLLFFMIISKFSNAQPPYYGTIFIDPDIITSSDPSSIQSTTYSGQGMVEMFDRRVNNWVTVNAYLFDVIWDDGLTSIAQINPEFGSVANATIEAEKYAFLIGQLPKILRENVNEIWVHQGVELFGGASNAILIHTGQTINYENSGILEETLVHEASHTSLDAIYSASEGWLSAQNEDDKFISTYALDNPTREDIAESFLSWLMVRYRQNNISTLDFNNITQTIPNRLNYFDLQNFDLSPFQSAVLSRDNVELEKMIIYPNPASEIIEIKLNDLREEDIKIYTVLGQDLTHFTSYNSNRLNISKLPKGHYILKVKTFSKKVYKN